MESIRSKDGTPIAFDRSGKGPAVIIVDGALCYRAFGPSAVGPDGALDRAAMRRLVFSDPAVRGPVVSQPDEISAIVKPGDGANMGGRSITGVSGPSGVVRSTIFKRPELSSSSNCDKIFAIFFYSFQFRNLGPGLLSHRFQATPELEAVLE